MANRDAYIEITRTQTLAGLVLSQRHQHNNPIIWKFITKVGVLQDLEEEDFGQQGRLVHHPLLTLLFIRNY